MDRERYAKMSREKKDERNRKDRERRMKKKGLANGKQLPNCIVLLSNPHASISDLMECMV
jgi:hypothetical protein